MDNTLQNPPLHEHPALCSNCPKAAVRPELMQQKEEESVWENKGHTAIASRKGGVVSEQAEDTPPPRCTAELQPRYAAALPSLAAYQCCWHSHSAMQRLPECPQTWLSHPRSDVYGPLETCSCT